MPRNSKRMLALLAPLFILGAIFLDLKQNLRHESAILPIPVRSTMLDTRSTTTPTVTVLRVVDGDTIDVMLDGNTTRVRLIGINAPESVDPRRPVQCFGKEASAYMHTLLDGRSVRLDVDISQDRYDKYGRLLAYIYRDDGLFINLAMISDGYAYEYTYSTPYQFQNEFKQTEHGARTALRGLWSASTCNGKL